MSAFSWKQNIKGTYGIAYVNIGIINDQSILEKEIRVQLTSLSKNFPEKANARNMNFQINIPYNQNGMMFNFAYVYFEDWEIFNAFIGLNFDGTPRKKYNLGGKISLDKLDPEILKGFPEEEFRAVSKKISSALNKISDSSFNNLKDVFVHEAIKHPSCIAFTINRIFKEVKDLVKPDLGMYKLKSKVFIAILEKLKQEGNHEIFLKIMFYELSRHEIDYKIFTFACILVQKGLLNIENFKEIIVGFEEEEAFKNFTKAVKFTEGELWRKCGKQLSEEFKKFSKSTKEYGNMIEFAIEDLREVMKEPLDSEVCEDWMLESEVEDLEPLVKFNYFLLPENQTKIMRDNYNEFSLKDSNIFYCKSTTTFLAGFEFSASYLKASDEILNHYKLVGRNFPNWITSEKVFSVFEKYSTADGYPKIGIDNNKLTCYVTFSSDQAHFQDAGFAHQMCKFVKFTDQSQGKSATVIFDFMKEYKNGPRENIKIDKPDLAKPIVRRFFKRRRF